MMPWYVAALGAALVWGLHYPLIDHALERVSLVTVLALTALPIVLLLPLFLDTLAADLRTLTRLGAGERWTVLALSLTSLLATVLLFVSIGEKNATMAGLIEITYPLFIVGFTWALFRQVDLNAGAAVGGLLIMAGAVMVILSSR